jgi:hypothetical protein
MMTAHPQSDSRATRGFLLLLAGVLLAVGCDQLPDPGVGDGPETASAPAPPPVDVTPVVPRTPERIIDEFLSTAPHLRTDEQLQELSALEAGLDRVTDLDLRESAVSDEGAEVLPQFAAATRLNLSGSRVTTDVTRHLAGMTWLEELDLSNLPIEDESIAALSELPVLRRLSLGSTPVTENCFRHLAEFASLESLTLDNNERLLGNGFSEMLRLRKLETLRVLSVNQTGFGYHGLDELNRLSQLESLSASNAEVTDPALEGIRSCGSLRTLNLSNNSRLSDAGLQRLTGLRNLEELDVSECVAISDAGLQYLRRHEQLRRLSLQGTSCTPAGAQSLKERFLKNTTILIAGQEL